MPYTMATLPDNVKRLPEAKQRQWLAVWTSAYAKCEKDGGGDCEASAFRQANGVVLSADPPDPVTVATFTLDAPADETGAFVVRRGKLFEVGDYPDKQFEMTPEELAAAAAAFTPVPVNLSHVPSVLDGALGEVQAVEVADDGRTLLGTVAIPKWLDSLLDDTGRKVSCEWDRATKQLRGLALVNRPRVPDAALMAAFAESELADFAGRRNSAGDQERIQRVHDMTIELGADCAGPAKMDKEGTKMSAWERIKAYFDGNPDAARAVFETETPPKPEPAPTPEPDKPDPEKVAMQARIAALEAERRQNAAATFADSLVAAKKALPAEKPAILAAFVRAAEDDAVHPATVTFGEGKSGGRVDALKALYDARPAHILTAETLPPDLNVEQVIAAFAAPKDQTTLTEERRRQLLASSPLGQAVLNAQNAQNGKGG